jgi:hypothetical protein
MISRITQFMTVRVHSPSVSLLTYQYSVVFLETVNTRARNCVRTLPLPVLLAESRSTKGRRRNRA